MTCRRIYFALALTLVLVAPAQAQTNTIRGKVRSANGATINNAIVELRIGGGGMISQTVTRNDGDFAFANLASGEYEVVVTLAGYETAVQMARFNFPDRMSFAEVLNIEVLIRPKTTPALPSPSTSFVQDVPKAARASYEKAVERLREGKSDEAIALMREAITIFDNYFEAHFQLGAEFYRLEKYTEALESLERARKINERDAGVYHLFGLVMLKQQKFAVAEFAFREATRINANSAASHFYRGQALVELAARGSDAKQSALDLGEAERALNRAWELSEKRFNAVYLLRARIYEGRGDKQAAARQLENYLRAEPDAKDAPAIREAITRLRGEKK